jgi:diguanylate cyclase (GGDEF)-like protein
MCAEWAWAQASPVAMQLQQSAAQAQQAVDQARRHAHELPARIQAEQWAAEAIGLYGDLHEVPRLLARWESEPDFSSAPLLRVDRRLLQALQAEAQGHHVEAARQLQPLLRGLPDEADEALRWRLELALARVAVALGQREEATRSLTTLIRKAHTAGRGDQEASAWSALAELQVDQRDYAEASRCYAQALAAAPAWARQTVAYARLGLAQMRNVLGQREEALADLAQPLAQFVASGNLRGEADTLLIQSYVLRKMQRYAPARVPLERSLALRRALGRGAEQVNSLTHLSGLMLNLQDPGGAVRIGTQATTLADATDEQSLRWDAYGTLAKAHAAKGDYKAAFAAMSTSERALLKFSQVEQISQSALFRERFDTERQALENARLQDRLDFERREQGRLTVTLGVMGLLLALLFVCVAALVRLYWRTRHHAQTDGLTGLLNRQRTLERCQEEVERAQRHALPLAVLMFDLDLFKAINDQHGHSAGDKVLTHVAHTIRSALRRGDVAGRVGGEEFLLVLPHTDATAALQLAERLRGLLEAHVSVVDGWPVTASFGVARLLPGQGVAELVQQADAALYRAKLLGRNRAALAGDFPASEHQPGRGWAAAA